MRFHTFLLKNLLRRKVRTLLTLCGVGVAVAAVVALVGIARGFETSFNDLYSKRGVDLIVVRAGTAQRENSSLPESAGERIRQLPGVRAVSPGLMDMVSYPEHNLLSVVIQGWALDSFLFSGLKIIAGRQLQAGDHHKAMLGTVLAKNLGVKTGETVEIEGGRFEVIGIFESFSVFENGSAVVLLRDLQELLDRAGQVTGFQIVLEDTPDKKSLIEATRKRLEEMRDDNGKSLSLSALPTEDYVSSTYQIRLGHAMAWLTSVIALFIGAIGMLNTMIMSVFERTKEIGILRAIGWRRSRVLRMILFESVLLSAGGAVVGIAAALVGTRLLSTFPAVSGMIQGTISPVVIGQGFVIALLVGLVGGLYPAYRGSRLLPTEALRHE
jgi:putative ABC transport system permease protein